MMNERHTSYGYSGGTYGGMGQHKPPVAEDTIKAEKIVVERKTFVIALKENPRGRFLRITEEVNGRRDTIIIPSTGLAEFKKIMDEMVKTSEETPEKLPPETPDPMA